MLVYTTELSSEWPSVAERVSVIRHGLIPDHILKIRKIWYISLLPDSGENRTYLTIMFNASSVMTLEEYRTYCNSSLIRPFDHWEGILQRKILFLQLQSQLTE